MRTFQLVGIAVSATVLATAAQAAGTVTVNFVEPDKYSDVRDNFMSAEQHLQALKRHLEEAAAPYLADGQTLKIDVLDVDLAGETRWGARLNNPRVLKGRADWPRIELRYALEAPGQAARSGAARVQDMAYLNRTAGLPLDYTLRYERRMLDEWFRAEFKK